MLSGAGGNKNVQIALKNWYNFDLNHSFENVFFLLKFLVMKKVLSTKIAGIFFLASFVAFLASFTSKNFETKTVTGEILDMKCYMTSGEHGPDHKECAAMCIKGGSPMGILAQDGKVYLLVEGKDGSAAFEEAKKHAGDTVTVTGILSEKNGVQALIVTDVKAKS